MKPPPPPPPPRCCPRRPSLLLPPSAVPLLLLLIFISSLSPMIEATKHTFTVRHDSRLLMGPIGKPFGFLVGGTYGLKVFDYRLSVREKKRDVRRAEGGGGVGDEVDGEMVERSKGGGGLVEMLAEIANSSAGGGNDAGHDDEYNHHDPQPRRRSRNLGFFTRNKPKDEDIAATEPTTRRFEGGFILKRFASESDFARYHEDLLENTFRVCSWNPTPTSTTDIENEVEYEGIYLNPTAFVAPDNATKITSVEHTFATKESEGLYFLIYQVCAVPPTTAATTGVGADDSEEDDPVEEALHILRNYEITSTFELDISLHNVDSSGKISYLTAGEMPLPKLFTSFGIIYLGLIVFWMRLLRRSGGGGGGAGRRRIVMQIHHMMTLLLILKCLSLLAEGARYHYIRIVGRSEFWTSVYYGLAFLKGVTLFTTILLIGSGWSFLKPFLHAREKKIIFVVLVLQILDNIVLIILTHETEGERLYEDWTAVLHLFDILCCVSVLVPIVWQVNSLEKSVAMDEGDRRPDGSPVTVENDGNVVVENGTTSQQPHSMTSKNRRAASKLRLFRSFYLLVVAYVYVTRVGVFLLASALGYRNAWLQYLASELATLAFYVVTGYKFRPRDENPYLELKREDYDDEEVDDEGFVFGNDDRRIEMKEVM